MVTSSSRGYGIGGHADYYIVWRILHEHPWVDGLLNNILMHAMIMGIGASRANGFGYVDMFILIK